MIKRILTILLCITLLCPACSFAEENSSFEIAEYNEAVRFLTSFGIIDGENPLLDTTEWTITRGEFISLALMCMGEAELAKSTTLENTFLDVPEDHTYAKEIMYAAHSELLGKDFGKFFQPDLTVTSDFAALVGVHMTGRGIMVNPTNTYMSLATKAHLFDGVQMYGNNEVSRGGAFMFMKNVLTAELVTYNSVYKNGELGGIKVEKDANILSAVLKYEKRRGILTADGITTVYGKNPEPGYVSVDGKEYLLLFNGAMGLAGRMVEYYVTEYEGEDAIKYLEECRGRTITIDGDSIVSFDPVNMRYRVLINDKGENFAVSRDAFISYNHEPYYDPTHMVPASGSVTFVDHNSDNVYDVVMIAEFTNTIVDYYNEYANTIFDINSRKDALTNENIDDICLDESRNNIYITDTKNNYVELNSLEKNSVVSVFKSADGSKTRIIVNTEKEEGVISVIDNENGTVEINDREYRFSGDIRFDKSSIRLGKTYTYYLDARGEIAYVSAPTGNMAYLLNAGRKGNLNSAIEVQLLDEESKKLGVYNLAKKVKYRTPQDEVTYKREELYERILLNGEGNFNRGMVVVSFNSAGELCEITTAMNISTYAQVFTAPEYPLYNLSYLTAERPEYSGSPGTSFEYKNSGDHLNRWVIVGSGAKVFYLPEDGAEIEDEEAVIVKGADSMSNGNTVTYNGYYSKDLKEIPVRYMIKRAAASSAATISNSWPYVVTKIVGCSHDTLGDTYRLTLEGTGDKYTAYAKDPSVIMKENFYAGKTLTDGSKVGGTDLTAISDDKKMVEVGDIIYCSKDASGNIDSVLMWWDSRSNIKDRENPRYGNDTLQTDEGMAWMNTNNKWRRTGAEGGLIERKNGSVLEISLDDIDTFTNTNAIQRVNWGRDMSTYLVEFSGKRANVKSGVSANELVKGDRIVITSRGSGQCYLAVVYRR